MSDRSSALQRLAQFKKALDDDPTNVEVATRYWSALASVAGSDVRSGGYVIEAFRECALDSDTGVIAFAKAYRELFEKSGEKPRAELFDKKLAQALGARLPSLTADDRSRVEWLLSHIS